MMSLHLCYTPDSFPVTSETFVISEIWGMLNKGHRITITPAREDNTQEATHDRLKEVLAKVEISPKAEHASWLTIWKAFCRAGHTKTSLKPTSLFRQYKRAKTVAQHAQRIVQTGADVIVTHFGFDNAVAAAIAAQIMNKPMVLVLHGSDLYTIPHRNLPWFSTVAGAVMTTTDYMEHEARRLGVTGDIHRSLLGIDLTQFRIDDNIAKETHPTLVCVARLAKNKNIPRLLRIFSQVHAKQPETKLWLVGDGPLHSELEKLADSLGIRDAIVFKGNISRQNIPALLNRAWIKCLMSDKEGMGVVLMEAQACGLPCVAADAGGIREVIADGKTGKVIDFDQPDAENQAAAAILQLIEDTELRMQMTKRGRVLAEERYDEQLHFEMIDKLLRELDAA